MMPISQPTCSQAVCRSSASFQIPLTSLLHKHGIRVGSELDFSIGMADMQMHHSIPNQSNRRQNVSCLQAFTVPPACVVMVGILRHTTSYSRCHHRSVVGLTAHFGRLQGSSFKCCWLLLGPSKQNLTFRRVWANLALPITAGPSTEALVSGFLGSQHVLITVGSLARVHEETKSVQLLITPVTQSNKNGSSQANRSVHSYCT